MTRRIRAMTSGPVVLRTGGSSGQPELGGPRPTGPHLGDRHLHALEPGDALLIEARGYTPTRMP